MNFGEVLSRAWAIIWKYKVLWIFGLLAGLAGGGGNGGSNSNFNRSGSNGFNFNFEFNNLDTWFQRLPAWGWVLLILVVLALIVVAIILGAIGRAGLVRGAWLGDSNETGITFSRLFSEGTSYFWKVLLLELLIIVIVLVSVIAFSLTICLLPLLCLLAPVFILLGVVVEFAVIAIVTENRGIMESLTRGWEVFRAHLPEVIGMAFVLWLGELVISFIITLPALAVLAPFVASFITGARNLQISGMIVSLVLFLIYLPFLLILRGILQSYVTTAWTVAFRRLTGRTAGTTTSEVAIEPV